MGCKSCSLSYDFFLHVSRGDKGFKKARGLGNCSVLKRGVFVLFAPLDAVWGSPGGFSAPNLGSTPGQVEATTGKRHMVLRGDGLFSRVARCTVITARPDLTGNYIYNVSKLKFLL